MGDINRHINIPVTGAISDDVYGMALRKPGGLGEIGCRDNTVVPLLVSYEIAVTGRDRFLGLTS